MPFERFESAAARAAALVRSKPPGTRWFLDCDTDADGLCAAAVTGAALKGLGHRFTIRASRDKGAAAYRALFDVEADGYITLDKGTSHLAVLAEGSARTGRPVLVVDHHNLTSTVPDGVALLNPRAEGLDGSRDASAATTAAALALALAGEAALAWAPVALSGAIGDWQHVPAWKGWNLDLLERARKAGHVRDLAQPRFIGVTLAEALARWGLPGLGDLAAATGFLASLGVEPDADVEELDAESCTRLLSACTLRILAAGGTPADAQALVETTAHNARLGTSLRHVFRIVDACGREGQASTGIAYLLGDKAAKGEAVATFLRYKSTLHEGLLALARQGTQVRQAVQVAWTANPDYTGMVAGLAMEHGVPDRTRPLCILAKRPDGRVQVSTRGLEGLVRSGLDLGKACQTAAASVGAEGGGHPVAAGAVVEEAKAEGFLSALDAALDAQGFRGAP